MEQPTAVEDLPGTSPSSTPQEGVSAPPMGKPGYQVVTLPNIILNHHDGVENENYSSPNAAQLREYTTDNDNDNFIDSDFASDDSDQSIDAQLDTARIKTLTVPKRQKKISCTGLRLTFDDDDISTNSNDNDIDNTNQSVDKRLDNPHSASLNAGPRGVQQFNVEMKLGNDDDISSDDDDDSDIDITNQPNKDQPGTDKATSLAVPQRRVKKVSYAGMTFDDMNWTGLRNQQHHTIKKNNETSKTKNGTEGYGSSDA